MNSSKAIDSRESIAGKKNVWGGVRLQNEQKAEIMDKETNEKDASRRDLLFPLPPVP